MNSSNSNYNNPWYCLSPFDEPDGKGQGKLFCGRDRETENLVNLIRENLFVTLYGQTGTGKSSLLKAGVFPILRKEQYLPIYIREELNKSEKTLAEVIISRVNEEIAKYNIQRNALVEKNTDVNSDSADYLWDYFSTNSFTDQDGKEIFPVIVLDQFEECYRTDKKRTDTLLLQFASLIDDNKIFPKGYSTKTNFRILLSIREDYLFYLEDTIEKFNLQELKFNRYRLHNLSDNEARNVILQPALRANCISEDTNVQDQVIKSIIDFVKGDSENRSLNTLILSLTCHLLYDSSQTGNGIINESLVKSFGADIIEDFYENVISTIKDSRERDWIENNLISASGLRQTANSQDLDKYCPKWRKLAEDGSKILSISNNKVEVIHDMLAEVMFKVREKRKIKNEKNRNSGIIVIWGILYSLIFIWSMSKCFGPALLPISFERLVSNADIYLVILELLFGIFVPIYYAIPKYMPQKANFLCSNMIIFLSSIWGLFWHPYIMDLFSSIWVVQDAALLEERNICKHIHAIMMILSSISILYIVLHLKRAKDSERGEANKTKWESSSLWQSEPTFRFLVFFVISATCIYFDCHGLVIALSLLIIPLCFAFVLFPSFITWRSKFEWNMIFLYLLLTLLFLDSIVPLKNVQEADIYMSCGILYLSAIPLFFIISIISIISKKEESFAAAVKETTNYIFLITLLSVILLTSTSDSSTINTAPGIFILLSILITICIGIKKERDLSKRKKIAVASALILATCVTYVYRIGFNPLKLNIFQVELSRSRHSYDADIWTAPVVLKHTDNGQIKYSICEPISGEVLINRMIDTVFMKDGLRHFGVKIEKDVDLAEYNVGSIYIDTANNLILQEPNIAANMLQKRKKGSNDIYGNALFELYNNTLDYLSNGMNAHIDMSKIDTLYNKCMSDLKNLCDSVNAHKVVDKYNMCMVLTRSLFSTILKENAEKFYPKKAIVYITNFDLVFYNWQPSQINKSYNIDIALDGDFIKPISISDSDLRKTDTTSIAAINMAYDLYTITNSFAMAHMADYNNECLKRALNLAVRMNERNESINILIDRIKSGILSLNIDSLKRQSNSLEQELNSEKQEINDIDSLVRGKGLHKYFLEYCSLTKEPIYKLAEISTYDYTFMKSILYDIISLKCLCGYDEDFNTYINNQIQQLESKKSSEILKTCDKYRELRESLVSASNTLATNTSYSQVLAKIISLEIQALDNKTDR